MTFHAARTNIGDDRFDRETGHAFRCFDRLAD